MLRNIPSATLRKLVVLSERKEALMAQVQDIEHEMVQIQQKIEAAAGRDLAPAPLKVKGAAARKRPKRTTRRRERSKQM